MTLKYGQSKGGLKRADDMKQDQARAASTTEPPTPAKMKKSKVPTTDTSVAVSSKGPAGVSSPKAISKSDANKPTLIQQADDFNAAYLRKITTELADDLDKVREAQDFKASSVAMLVHALKQGGEVFSVEERRRFCGASS